MTRADLFLFELSGEDGALVHAELEATAQAESAGAKCVRKTARLQAWEMPLSAAKSTASRLAMAYSCGRVLASSASLDDILGRIPGIPKPRGTVAVRSEKYSHYPKDNLELQRLVGGAICSQFGARADLVQPQTEYRLVYDGEFHLCMTVAKIDRGAFEARTPHKRLFFSPTTMHPRLARTLVNLSGVRRGGKLLDPFCGTGGVLIEAGLIGAKIAGSDLSGEMMGGAIANLEHYGLSADYYCADIGELPAQADGKFDAVATDPPYGRAATTGGEALERLYKRTFAACAAMLNKGGGLSIILPQAKFARLGCGKDFGLRLLGVYPMRVHRSLTRHFCVYRKE